MTRHACKPGAFDRSPEAVAKAEADALALIELVMAEKWTAVRIADALQGIVMREHNDHAHPDQTEETARLRTATMPEPEREAWLVGYRFKDRDGNPKPVETLVSNGAETCSGPVPKEAES